jgi:DNA-binding beta-propeller fold protein YncE
LPVRRTALVAALTTCLALIAVLAPAPAFAAGKGVLRGTVPMRGMNVVLMAARPGGAAPVRLGATRSLRGGNFVLRYRGAGSRTVKYVLATRPGGGAEAGFPVLGNSYRLAAALGAGRVPRRAAVNEATTVATGYAMAQFIEGGRVAGKNPGLRNAAAMTRNLVRPRNGATSRLLRSFPNGNSTTTLRAFGTLANLLSVCRQQTARCAALLRMASVPGGGPASDTLAATVSLARYPWHNVAGLFKLAEASRHLYRPSLPPRRQPDAWTLALRFESNPGLDGPGNIAIDRRGTIWVANNYTYSRESQKPACFGRSVFRFTPIGRQYPGSPYESGGTSGVGFGITIDQREHVWVGNFGFSGKGCREEPPHNSVSEYTIDGKALSPDLVETGIKLNSEKELVRTYKGGWEVGDISWPQATVADVNNNIWVANCGNNSVTVLPDARPFGAVNLPESHFAQPLRGFGFSRPFGIATDAEGNAYIGGNESATVVKVGPGGEVLGRFSGGGLHRPMSLATDSSGNVWVSNSTWVVAPCVGQFSPEGGPRKGGTMTLIRSNGEISAAGPYRNGGIKNPWGVAVDGDDNVWVANFSGRRLSALCGTVPRNCPAGKRQVGASISPAATGYGFNGLTRVTGLAVDPSGNVWLVNNWKNAPIQTNPGEYQIVAYLGLAAPVKTPLIGAPEQP